MQGGPSAGAGGGVSRATVIKVVIASLLVLMLVLLGFYLGRPIYWRIVSEESEAFSAGGDVGGAGVDVGVASANMSDAGADATGTALPSAMEEAAKSVAEPPEAAAAADT